MEKSENAALPFSCGQRICILSPSTSSLWPLNPVTSHNNNNNGGLHACVCAAEDIEPFLQLTCLVVECELQQQFDLIIGPHKRFWFPCISHFLPLVVVFGFSVYCLFVYNVQALWACSVCLLRFWWISSATYRPGIWTTAFTSIFSCFQWIRVDANILETRQRKTEEKKDCFHTCEQGLRVQQSDDMQEKAVPEPCGLAPNAAEPLSRGLHGKQSMVWVGGSLW